jgi:chloride channel 7
MSRRAIGSLYGRLLGKSIYDILRTTIDDTDEPAEWDFTDPGALALIGAASFFAGTSRLPITSVVMMVCYNSPK